METLQCDPKLIHQFEQVLENAAEVEMTEEHKK